MIIPRRRVCETSLTFSFCSKSRTPVGRPWHARECGAMTIATVLETLIERPRSARAREVSFSAAETVLQARAADVHSMIVLHGDVLINIFTFAPGSLE